jgi:hypothetical protein
MSSARLCSNGCQRTAAIAISSRSGHCGPSLLSFPAVERHGRRDAGDASSTRSPILSACRRLIPFRSSNARPVPRSRASSEAGTPTTSPPGSAPISRASRICAGASSIASRSRRCFALCGGSTAYQSWSSRIGRATYVQCAREGDQSASARSLRPSSGRGALRAQLSRIS